MRMTWLAALLIMLLPAAAQAAVGAVLARENDPSPRACNDLVFHYDIVADFGAVAGADDTSAFNSFNTEAQRRTRPAEEGYAGGANGAGNAYADAADDNCIDLTIPAGAFSYSSNSWSWNISRLRITGAGSGSTTLENTASSGGDQRESAYVSNNDYFGVPSHSATYGYLIDTADAGATSVTLAGSAANASNYVPGRWVMIASYSQQYTGLPMGSASYPPNFRYYDWAKVTSANTSTGVVTFDTPLAFTHRSDRPYYGTTLTDGPAGSAGPARIMPIDTASSPVAVYQEVDGIHFLVNPNFVNMGADCVQFIGIIDGSENDVVDDTCMAFSQIRNFTASNSSWPFDEADKLISNLTYDNDTINSAAVSGGGTYNHSDELMWHVIGGHITNFKTSCCGPGINIGARNILIEGATLIDGPSISGGDYNHGLDFDDDWQTVSAVVNGATIKGDNDSNNRPFNAPQRQTQTVDGTTITVESGPNGANTRLAITKAFNTYGSPSERIKDDWGDGDPVWKDGAWVSGAVITAITGDANDLYVDVSGTTFATNDTVYASKLQSLTVENCTGVNTGFTWTTSNVVYPNGSDTIPSITWTNNSGN